jgi:hypothetical protein
MGLKGRCVVGHRHARSGTGKRKCRGVMGIREEEEKKKKKRLMLVVKSKQNMQEDEMVGTRKSRHTA